VEPIEVGSKKWLSPITMLQAAAPERQSGLGLRHENKKVRGKRTKQQQRR